MLDLYNYISSSQEQHEMSCWFLKKKERKEKLGNEIEIQRD